jgi:alpha-amylase/alpha-mannosidase (GH57 family)
MTMYLSILWHLHQPIYRDPETNKYILPWVNYHITKNYYQMAALAEEQGFPCTFNLVPCLLEQMEDYGQGKAKDIIQETLEMTPEKLKPAQVKQLAKFLPRGTEENDKAKLQLGALQSFFSPLLKTKADKDSLLELQKKIQKQVLPYYRKLWKNGLSELTTSAYYHPLLPLVFNVRAGGEVIMPRLPFAHPEDGEAQVKNGREYFKRMFGDYPEGFWPPEGGLSQEVARSVAQKEFAFAVTDENILWKSLNTAPDLRLLHQPYLCQNLTVFFRDRELSDLLSFEYHKWDEKAAAAHFLAKLEGREKLSPEEEAICVLALDGENPWAGYRQNGVPFLREFYSRIKQNKGITPVFFKDYLARHKPKTEIILVPGTWMGNFSKWVGSPAKNAAWDSLYQAREACGPKEEILIAEGSDWFWWFGEENTAEFERLFKGYLQKAYASEGKKPSRD